MIKLDLHTHSSASPDGGITPEQYADVIERGVLDYMAITDHNTIAQAKSLHESLGDRIIIGEEIMTTQGELIGLFLTERIKPGLTPVATARAITAQGGLVYVPHPFETVRSGITEEVLNEIRDEVDIIEVQNGRAFFQNRGPKAHTWARLNNKATASSSDAHGKRGLGTSYVQVKQKPTVKNLLHLLREAHFSAERAPLVSLLYPKYHVLRKKVSNKT